MKNHGGPDEFKISIGGQDQEDAYPIGASTKETKRRKRGRNKRTCTNKFISLIGVMVGVVAISIFVLYTTTNIFTNRTGASGEEDLATLTGNEDAPDAQDSYEDAPLSVLCPAERQQTQVCQEVYGMTYCGEARSLQDCHSSCVKTVRSHLGVSYVCQSNDAADRAIEAYVQDDPSHWSRQRPSPISRRTILDRGVTWLKSRVRYSQRRYHSEPSVSDGKKYRTDCTGYLSMCWGIPQIGTTSWLRAMKDVPTEGVTNHNKIFSSVACSDLRPGDALVNTGHVVLFRRWSNRTTGAFLVWEAKGTIYGTIESAKAFVEDYSSSSLETGFRTTDSSSTYYCLRRRNLVVDSDDDTTAPPVEDDDDDDEGSNDVYPGFNSACSLRPEMSSRIVDESDRAAGIWNMYGGYLERRASELDVRVEDLVAVLQIESGGKGFDKVTKKPIVRFEIHVFKRMLENAGVYDASLFEKHFQYDPSQGWRNHMFRGGTLGNPIGDWVSFHGNQVRENEVLSLAASWNEEAAYRSASYGLPQIMGFNFAMMDHPSAKSMYESFSSSVERQIDGLFAFLENSVKSCSGLHTSHIAAIEHLRQNPPNYIAFACNYNGNGQREYYGGRIEDASASFRALPITSTEPASTTGTACNVMGIRGFCVDDGRCNGRSEPGFCPGAANIKCCIDCDGRGSA